MNNQLASYRQAQIFRMNLIYLRKWIISNSATFMNYIRQGYCCKPGFTPLYDCKLTSRMNENHRFPEIYETVPSAIVYYYSR
jgi:hypothetical protein